MKRFIYFICLSTIALNSHASSYYDSYGSSDSSEWLSFFLVLMFVWGILQIILFFKLWGMTNDIRELKNDHFTDQNHRSISQLLPYLRKNYFLGNKEEVKKALIQNFIDEINGHYNELPMYKMIKQENGKMKDTFMGEENMLMPLAPFINNLIKQFYKIGEEVPDFILKLETYKDYYEFFVKEDFEINK